MVQQDEQPAVMMGHTTEELMALDKQYHLPTYKRYPVVIREGKGSRLWDTEGKEYIDAVAGIAVNSVGHGHPYIVQTIADQAVKLIHISNGYLNEPQALLAQKLAQLSGLQYAFFCNSGAEAVEGAMKIARKYAQKHGRGGNVITLHHAFHGRTMATVAATGKKSMMAGFDPIPAGYLHVPANDMEVLKAIANNSVAAIMVEPVQGEGGIWPMEKGYLQDLRAFCTEQNIVLILDEIQCGMGRTGSMFAYEQYGIMPDIMPLAKALGGGMPIGAVLASANMGGVMAPGDHGSTFGGNPLACAVALATIEIIEKENLVAEAKRKGADLIKKLQLAMIVLPVIKEVRGMGLMVGVELNVPSRPLVEQLLHRGIMVNSTADTVIRLVPPLNIPDSDLDRVVEELLEVLGEVQPS